MPELMWYQSAMNRIVPRALVLLVACSAPQVEGGNAHPKGGSLTDSCQWTAEPQILLDHDGAVLKLWSFGLEAQHLSFHLPEDAAFKDYRSLIESQGRAERYPALYVPPAQDSLEAAVWADELFNNRLVYASGIGLVQPISCLDALLFAHHNSRTPQLERQTEFVASILRRTNGVNDEVTVIFGAGDDTFPPMSVFGFAYVREYVDQGWEYWYLLHNHTRQANGVLGVPAPSTSDVRFTRGLADEYGLQRVRVTNGFYSFDAAIAELATLRSR
jgi:hypothetical protein